MEKINALCGLQMSLTCGCVFLVSKHSHCVNILFDNVIQYTVNSRVLGIWGDFEY